MPMPDAKFWRNLERMLWILVVLAGIAEAWWIFMDIWGMDALMEFNR